MQRLSDEYKRQVAQLDQENKNLRERIKDQQESNDQMKKDYEKLNKQYQESMVINRTPVQQEGNL